MCGYGIKKWKHVLCSVVVGLLDICARGQSDVTSVERRGMFGDLRLSNFLQSGEEESQYGWCVVSSFVSLSLFFLRAGVSCPLVLSAFFWSAPLSRNLFLILFFSSDRIKLCFICFLPWRSWIGRKITFNYFYFLSNFVNILLCTNSMHRNPFFHFGESLSTYNIQWMLLWALVILCTII